jgi:hypothetical protein
MQRALMGGTMEERPEDWDAKRHHDETLDPANPPNSVLSKPVRRAALASYLGPIIALFLIVGFGLMYWAGKTATREPEHVERDRAVGTAGGTTPGGFDNQPKPNSTRDEIERRGGVSDPATGPMPALRGNAPLTSIAQVLGKANDVAGRPVDLKSVEVDSTQGATFWVRDGDDKTEVVPPAGANVPQKGARLHVVGTVEAVGTRTRVQASAIDVE